MQYFNTAEVVLVGVLSIIYFAWDAKSTGGEVGDSVELKYLEIDKQDGGQAPPSVVNQKELELVKRGVELPVRPYMNPGLYDAQLDKSLMDSADSAGLMQPMRPNRLEEYGTPSWKTAGKVMQDMLYWKYPRETPKPPQFDWVE
jgi:hypothetical protein